MSGGQDGAPRDPAPPEASQRPSPEPRRRHRRVVRPGREQPVLSPTSDDADVGWGDRPEPDDAERLRRDVPPHWGKD